MHMQKVNTGHTNENGESGTRSPNPPPHMTIYQYVRQNSELCIWVAKHQHLFPKKPSHYSGKSIQQLAYIRPLKEKALMSCNIQKSNKSI